MSSSGCSLTISPGGLAAVGEGQLDGRGAVDHVAARQDVAALVDDHAAAEAAALVVPGTLRSDALGLDQHERGLDRLVDGLGEGRRRRDGGERARDAVLHVLRGQRRRARGEDAVEDDGGQRDGGPGGERARPRAATETRKSSRARVSAGSTGAASLDLVGGVPKPSSRPRGRWAVKSTAGVDHGSPARPSGRYAGSPHRQRLRRAMHVGCICEGVAA